MYNRKSGDFRGCGGVGMMLVWGAEIVNGERVGLMGGREALNCFSCEGEIVCQD